MTARTDSERVSLGQKRVFPVLSSAMLITSHSFFFGLPKGCEVQ